MLGSETKFGPSMGHAGYDWANASVVYHLPAYVALQRWASGRTVVVVEPDDLDGARLLRSAGARRVVVLGGSHKAESGLEWVADWDALPKSRGSVDLVLCIERYQRLEAHQRHELLAEGRARLSSSGIFAAWAPHEGHGVDFWTLEEEMRRRFRRVFMLAELPWSGVSLAPVVDEHRGDGAPTLGLDESLLDAIPSASHYLAVGTVGEPAGQLLLDLTSQCLLVPVPQDSRSSGSGSAASNALRDQLQFELARSRDEVLASKLRIVELTEEVLASNQKREEVRATTAQAEQAADQTEVIRRAREQHGTLEAKNGVLQAELETAKARARQGETDLIILTKNVADLEESLTRATQSAQAKAVALDARASEINGLATRLEAAAAERESLNHQLQLVLAEREGARQLSTRVEAELELSRRRLAKAEEQLSSKLQDASRLQAEAEVARVQADQKEALLEQARSREEKLSASAAENAEHGRVLTEVALDRDRLREELGRRSNQISELEDRLWNAREEVQRERLEGVRVTSEVERLREQAERSRHVETERSQDVQRLSAELHKIELERADLLGVARSRKEDIERLRTEALALAGETDEVAALRTELSARGRELAELTGKLEVARGREQEALGVTRKREGQLSEIGSELERLRRSAEEHAAMASGLQSELDVKSLEVEQLAASVSDLQVQLGDQRLKASASEAREDELQRDIERSFADREEIRSRLREREQELEDLVGAHETSGVEVYKLRRELEVAATANEQLEEALGLQPGTEPEPTPNVDHRWPEAAQVELRRVKGQVAAQTRRHAEQLAARDAQAASTAGVAPSKINRLQLEIEIRGAEQEHMLGQLDAAEQRIWEMSDAADRNAARLAAALAQLEKHREELDDTRDELEVTRKLLAASQARALEQERLLASERAKLARVGAGVGSRGNLEETVDVLFADLDDGGDNMVDLTGGFGRDHAAEPAKNKGVPSKVSDRDGSDVLQVRAGPRVVVEALHTEEAPQAEDPWAKGVTAAPSSGREPASASGGPAGAEVPGGIQGDGPPKKNVQRNKRGT